MGYHVRAVRAEDWPRARELRLAALADPVASVAFLETHETAAERPDSFWRQRAEQSERGTDVRQFIAEPTDGDGPWAGMMTVLAERPGEGDFQGRPVAAPQAHLVGVYVRPAHRGPDGPAAALVTACVNWAWTVTDPALHRIRLFVHENNPRAAAFYKKTGFTPTGHRIDHDAEMEIPRP